jgi:RNA polymerase sigma factor (sigma-70 family)
MGRLLPGKTEQRSARPGPAAGGLLRANIEFVSHPRFVAPDAEEFVASLNPRTPHEPSTSGTIDLPPAGDLRALFASPLLTPAEERFHFCRMNFLKFQAARLSGELTHPRRSLQSTKQIDIWLAEALSLRNLIIKSNVRLIVPLANRFTEPRLSFEQLLSEGSLPLLRAAELFDFSRGYRFSTYATWAIRNQLLRCRERYARDTSRFLFKSTLLEEATACPSSEDDTERQATRHRQLTSRFLNQLADRDRTVVEARFGLADSGRAHSFSEIGRLLGLSKERARQLVHRAVAQLQQVRLPEMSSTCEATPGLTV